jgi:enamine deaminase RidA (YjgF/YER057c/UK114 family)
LSSIIRTNLINASQTESFIHIVPPITTSEIPLLMSELAANNVAIVRQVTYGSSEFNCQVQSVFENRGQNIDWPSVWVPSNSNKSNDADGIFIHAISNTNIERLFFNDKVIASCYNTDSAKVCFINGLQPTDFNQTRPEQAQDTFLAIQRILKSANMELTDIVRTWFYNNDILGWYDDFNKVRTFFYQECGVYKNRIPASTGVGVFHPQNAAITAHVLAMQPLTDNFQITNVESPLQCSATSYGSTFSRATKVAFPDYEHVYVSGTASINDEGETVCLDDLKGQVLKTFKVVNEILQSCDMSYKDVVSGVVYLKHYDDIARFQEIQKELTLLNFPAIVTENIVCRDNLLFEIEVEAISRK